MKKLLIVDDDRNLRLLVSETLADDGCQILHAADGEEGLAVARRERPQLVLLDVAMPRLDGVEVCRRLKTDPATREITVIMLTAKGQAADRARGMAAGADEYLTKPFSPLQLLRLAGQVMKAADHRAIARDGHRGTV